MPSRASTPHLIMKHAAAQLVVLMILVAACAQGRGARPAAPGSASSGEPATASPEDVAQLTLRAMIRGDYLAVARRTDPAELQRTRAAFEPLLRADSGNYIAQRLFRLETTEQLRQLSDAEFTAGLMRFQLGLRGAQEYFAVVQGVDVAGTVRQGLDTAHVVYRWQVPPDSAPVRSYQVETLVRCATGWCRQMAGDYSGLIRLLQEPMVPVGTFGPGRPPRERDP